MWETTYAKLCAYGRMMKLPKPSGCSFSDGGGNVKERTMIVEEQGIGFRTGVRFPSAPLKQAPTFLEFSRKIGVFFVLLR